MTELVRRIFPRWRLLIFAHFSICHLVFLTFVYWRLYFRCNAEVVIGNLFKVKPKAYTQQSKYTKTKNLLYTAIMFQVFDPDNSGSVVPTELLVAFSMSMKGSVTDKLRLGTDTDTALWEPRLTRPACSLESFLSKAYIIIIIIIIKYLWYSRNIT